MPEATYLAFDFGASSGRAIIGKIKNKISLAEVHRFSNPHIKMLNHLCWDLPYLFNELKTGLIKARSYGSEISGIGVDTWGVDFGLVGKSNMILGNPIMYRDARTDGMMEVAFNLIPKAEVYKLTGIQFMQFNTIYQLLSLTRSDNLLLKAADNLLFMPDLFNFLMTGEKVSEYTIASTSQLLNAKTRKWESTLFKNLCIPQDIMAPIIEPGIILGQLVPELLNDTGLSAIDVITSAGHDTACAVAAVPAHSSQWAYLSSGTWSLIGIETDTPIITEMSFQNGFTNEGGVANKIRFLKNVMGMWLVERCRSKWEQEGNILEYDQLLSMAQNAKSFKCVIDPDDVSFLNPADMPKAIINYCVKTNQPCPQSYGEFIRCILESLALKYRFCLEKISIMNSKSIDVLHIVGGGSQNKLLNQFTANATGVNVIAGPVEATAVGNIIVQAIAKRDLNSLQEGRELIRETFQLQHFEPQDQANWGEIYDKNKHLFSM